MTAALSHPPLREPIRTDSQQVRPAFASCAHCGTRCPDGTQTRGDLHFCCIGCLTVHELLHEHGLGEFYRLGAQPGQPVRNWEHAEQFDFLNEPSVRSRLLDYSDERLQRVTFHVPAIHCVACIWLLENLFRLHRGIGTSTVNFARREVSIAFNPNEVTLGRIAALLASLGYSPDLTLADLDRRRGSPVPSRLWLQLGVAGFAFGNTMLFSLAGYFGLDVFSGPAFQKLFGALSLLLAIPVVVFSAADYWRTAWLSLRQRRLSLEVPIVVGIAALFAQSVFEIVSGQGEGYFDSLAGLLFFLLCGRAFQHKVFDRLSFDRDYRAFFPLSVLKIRSKDSNGVETVETTQRVSLAQLQVRDRLRLQNGELIPADARLLSREAEVDYSFVTGESEPIRRDRGDVLYAGGRLSGGSVDVEIIKPVFQSYLTSLWNQEAFRKDRINTFHTLTNQYSVRFTWIILAIAIVAGGYWLVTDSNRAVRAFVGVLIVACPCALALAAPFTLGNAVRVLGRRGVFLRNAHVIETMARIGTIVFDKTGTLTSPQRGQLDFVGDSLTPAEAAAVRALALQSTHPLARCIASAIAQQSLLPEVHKFREINGSGVSGRISGVEWRLGSAAWLHEGGLAVPAARAEGSAIHVSKGGDYRGQFLVQSPLRREVDQLIDELDGNYDLALLSGDHPKDEPRFRALFKIPGALHFGQSPMQKLEFIRKRQHRGQAVMMVGDGLNDAGALRQSDVGVAVVEQIGTFSPASDVILEASRVHRLGRTLQFARTTVGLVRASFLISALYNVVGISIAAAGQLSPVVCAVLMPLSSVSVIAFAVGTVQLLGRRAGLGPIVEATDREVQP